MKVSKSYKVSGSSITESVIAMTIVAFCLGIAMLIYGRVIQSDHNIAFYKAQQKVKELLWETKNEYLIQDEDYDFETYSIHKEVEELIEEISYKITFKVVLNNHKKSYQYIVNF